MEEKDDELKTYFGATRFGFEFGFEFWFEFKFEFEFVFEFYV